MIRILDAQQIGDLGLRQKAVARYVVEVDEVDLLKSCCRSFEVIALDNKKLMICYRCEVPDGLARPDFSLETIEPLPSCIALPCEVEFVDDQPVLIRIGGERSLQHGIKCFSVWQNCHSFETATARKVRCTGSKKGILGR